jgi:hypothetical protein
LHYFSPKNADGLHFVAKKQQDNKLAVTALPTQSVQKIRKEAVADLQEAPERKLPEQGPLEALAI